MKRINTSCVWNKNNSADRQALFYYSHEVVTVHF